jgi:hypothetical protein
VCRREHLVCVNGCHVRCMVRACVCPKCACQCVCAHVRTATCGAWLTLRASCSLVALDRGWQLRLDCPLVGMHHCVVACTCELNARAWARCKGCIYAYARSTDCCVDGWVSAEDSNNNGGHREKRLLPCPSMKWTVLHRAFHGCPRPANTESQAPKATHHQGMQSSHSSCFSWPALHDEYVFQFNDHLSG